MFTNYFTGQRRSSEAQTRDLLDIVFDHQENEVHLGSKEPLVRFLFMKKTNGV